MRSCLGADRDAEESGDRHGDDPGDDSRAENGGRHDGPSGAQDDEVERRGRLKRGARDQHAGGAWGPHGDLGAAPEALPAGRDEAGERRGYRHASAVHAVPQVADGVDERLADPHGDDANGPPAEPDEGNEEEDRNDAEHEREHGGGGGLDPLPERLQRLDERMGRAGESRNELGEDVGEEARDQLPQAEDDAAHVGGASGDGDSGVATQELPCYCLGDGHARCMQRLSPSLS
ncbi:hypothetical protein BS78_02G344200 [Paspalum vaginatum]|nr:hypothetical protein BS78_02G344200 [Paspalum vaginatum]